MSVTVAAFIALGLAALVAFVTDRFDRAIPVLLGAALAVALLDRATA